MALLQLGFSPPHHQPHFPLLNSPSPSLICINARISGWRGRYLCHRRSSSITAVSSSPATEPAAEDSVESAAEPRTRLIAQNIPWSCTAQDIKNLFERHGTVLDVELSMYDKSRNRGLAFITMALEEEAVAAITNLSSYDFDGRVIKVEFSTSLKKKPSVKAVPVQGYNVFVGNLSWKVRSRDLRELFSADKNVLSTEVIFQTNPRRPAGYGFVSFSSKQAAEAALAAFNGKKLMGRPIRLVLKENQTYGSEGEPNGAEQFDEASSEVDAA